MNKKIVTTAIISIMAISFFASCNARRQTVQDPTYDVGVVINGVRWATRNVSTLGTFARNPESAGGLFSGLRVQNACPHGWRLPTREEFESLRYAGVERTSKNGVIGHTFGTAPNQVFLPATGYRNWEDLLTPGGVYWSSTPWRSSRSNLSGWYVLVYDGGFGGANSIVTGVGFDPNSSFSVRCVAE